MTDSTRLDSIHSSFTAATDLLERKKGGNDDGDGGDESNANTQQESQ